MANTAQFDGEAAKVFSALADCPEDEIKKQFDSLCGVLRRKQGAIQLIERQHGPTAKKIRKRLRAHKLI